MQLLIISNKINNNISNKMFKILIKYLNQTEKVTKV